MVKDIHQDREKDDKHVGSDRTLVTVGWLEEIIETKKLIVVAAQSWKERQDIISGQEQIGIWYKNMRLVDAGLFDRLLQPNISSIG